MVDRLETVRVIYHILKFRMLIVFTTLGILDESFKVMSQSERVEGADQRSALSLKYETISEGS